MNLHCVQLNMRPFIGKTSNLSGAESNAFITRPNNYDKCEVEKINESVVKKMNIFFRCLSILIVIFYKRFPRNRIQTYFFRQSIMIAYFIYPYKLTFNLIKYIMVPSLWASIVTKLSRENSNKKNTDKIHKSKEIPLTY